MAKAHVRLHYTDNMRDVLLGSHAAALAGQPHSLVFDGEVDADTRWPREIAEVCFDVFNRHDSPTQHEALDRLEIRSLSVGDIVEVVDDGAEVSTFWVCEPVGFTEIEFFPGQAPS